MTTNIALGLLFLGGGTKSLGTSNEDIAALVTAFFPRFPLDSLDNRYHLQALRHLYVLAVAPCVVVTRDVDTGEACHVPMKMVFRDGERLTALNADSPCIVPRLPSTLEVRAGGYWGVHLDLEADAGRAKSLVDHGIVFVKRLQEVVGGVFKQEHDKYDVPTVQATAAFEQAFTVLESADGLSTAKVLLRFRQLRFVAAYYARHCPTREQPLIAPSFLASCRTRADIAVRSATFGVTELQLRESFLRYVSGTKNAAGMGGNPADLLLRVMVNLCVNIQRAR